MADDAPAPSGERNAGFAVIVGAVGPGGAKCSRIGRKVAAMLRGRVHSRDPTSNGTPRCRQRRRSAERAAQSSCVIIARKSRKEPEPPQRSWSLLAPHAASGSPKRCSCPPIGVCHPPSHSASSSSSSSSCSSPPPVPTSVITGRDPLGWKLHPKPGSPSPRARAKRLSLQSPLPVFCPDPKPSPAPGSRSHGTPTADPSVQTRPPLPLDPPRRRHSDSSAFRGPPPAFAAPAVTLEDLCAVRLRPTPPPEGPDDVFSDATEGQGKPRRTPPPVPGKSFMARQVAQLIAQSRRRQRAAARPVKAEGDACGADCKRAQAAERGLRLDASCTSEPLGSRFPDREA
ncbi:uncharacterized protein LOC114845418 isoform X2 [Betta splendens]|uniref:Uncharacterized protein LOC114845418 isoform X2 n=1 Tax=Betta splendens TaxID=158456 RepID=A0A6P7L5G8_BETSP|nr:uncharacterized protein LOC114845418 isoform X2 [Betta splendens]